MKVKLISVSKPELYLQDSDIYTPEDLIAYCARVSNPKNQDNSATSGKLIKYLVKHKHWSPFEMVNVCMEIETTRDIARQILRHRSFTFQEFSQRYADPSMDLGFILRECRLQDPKNRQSSTWCSDEELQEWWQYVQDTIIDTCGDLYTQAIRRGIAKEVARAVLPEGLVKSRMYMNGTVRSWIHYCELRTGMETQKEHREIAQACAFELIKAIPIIGEIENGEES